MRYRKTFNTGLALAAAFILIAGPFWSPVSHGRNAWAPGWTPSKQESEKNKEPQKIKEEKKAKKESRKEDIKSKEEGKAESKKAAWARKGAESAFKRWEKAREKMADYADARNRAVQAVGEARKEEKKVSEGDKKAKKRAVWALKRAEKALEKVQGNIEKAERSIEKARTEYIKKEDGYHEVAGTRIYPDKYASLSRGGAAPSSPPVSAAEDDEPPSVSDADTDPAIGPWAAYFPWEEGQRRLYISYYASRKHRQRKLIQASLWSTAVEVTNIHGFRVIAVQRAAGSMTKKDGKWVYGDPETILNEGIFVVAPDGIVLHSSYKAESGTQKDYKKMRKAALKELRNQSKNGFISAKKKWVLPFPVKPGIRKAFEQPGSFVKILRKGDSRFVAKQYKDRAIGTASFESGKWDKTRWFVPGVGLVAYETHNSDGEVNRAKFPFKIMSLAVFADTK